MKTNRKVFVPAKAYFTIIAIAYFLMTGLLQSCIYIDGNNDGILAPGGTTDRTFRVDNFTRLEMGNAFNVTVRRAANFSLVATGDQTDIDDLEAFVSQNDVLVLRYRNRRARRYQMDVRVSMPDLRGIDFSGAVNSTIEGFDNLRVLDIKLSGASKSTAAVSSERVEIDLSGASQLNLRGSGLRLGGTLSGASRLDAFDYGVEDADLDLSGASTGRVLVSKSLIVRASGASDVRYRGNAEVRSNLSGSSTVRKD
jgi:Putative auto-transporter adhesin, head GIN domain